MARFDLDQIKSFMDDTPEINIALPTGGAYLLQCALSTMDKQWQWMDDGDNLTSEQWDELQADIAALMLALITEVEDMGVPIGFIIPSAASHGVGGYLLCDGAEYSYLTYPLLFGAIDEVFHTGEGNFVVPDLSSRYVLGHGGGEDVADTGGERDHTLIVDEMPAHGHGIRYAMDTSASGSSSRLKVTSPTTTDWDNVLSTGGDAAHNNLPPFIVLKYWIRAY